MAPRLFVFPRPIGRGLIEAWARSRFPVLPESFPRPIGRGLIEAGADRHDCSGGLLFPRPIGRGLIEARFVRSDQPCQDFQRRKASISRSALRGAAGLAKRSDTVVP